MKRSIQGILNDMMAKGVPAYVSKEGKVLSSSTLRGFLSALENPALLDPWLQAGSGTDETNGEDEDEDWVEL